MALRTFTMLCTHHHYLVPKVFHHPKRKPIPIKLSLLIPPSPQSLATINWLSVSMVCLFWIIYINKIIQYVAFCIWLLHLECFQGSSLLQR